MAKCIASTRKDKKREQRKITYLLSFAKGEKKSREEMAYLSRRRAKRIGHHTENMNFYAHPSQLVLCEQK